VFFVLVAIAAISFVLGMIGWRAEEPGSSSDWPTLVHRTTALFLLDDSGAGSAPWQLDLARVLAPIVALAALLNWLVSDSAERLQSWASARATGHQVLIGPPDRLRPYVSLNGPANTVHVTIRGEQQMAGVLNAGVDWLTEPALSSGDRPTSGMSNAKRSWSTRCAVRRAERVVIATDDDQTNLSYLAELLRALEEPDDELDLHIIVELNDPALLPWLSLSLSHSTPGADVELVCRHLTVARKAVQEVMGPLDAPHSKGAHREVPAVVALLGDSQIAQVAGPALVRALTDWHLRHAGWPHPVVLVLDRERLLDPNQVGPRVEVALHADLESLLDSARTLTAAVVLYTDPDESLRVGTRLRYANLSAEIWVPARAKELSGGLLALSTEVIEDASDLEGPLTHIARARYQRLRLAHTELVSWEDLTPRARRGHVRAVRQVIDSLNDIDDLVLSATASTSAPLEPLPMDLATRVFAPPLFPEEWPTSHATAEELAKCPYWLAQGGLHVVARTS